MRPISLMAVAVNCLAATAAIALSTDQGVRALSFGSAFRAVADANDTIFYNPAGLIKDRRLAADVDYLYFSPDSTHSIAASILDAKTSAWGMGLAYRARIDRNASPKADHLFYLATAMPIVSDTFALGTSLSYRYHPTEKREPYSHYFNMDVGLLAQLPLGLSFAAVLDHLLKPKGSEKPMGLAIATAFDLEQVTKMLPLILSLDYLMDDVSSDDDLHHVVACGAQYTMLNLIPLRFGFKTDVKRKDKLLSMGTGVLLGHFSLDGLYQQHLAVGKVRNFGLALRTSF